MENAAGRAFAGRAKGCCGIGAVLAKPLAFPALFLCAERGAENGDALGVIGVGTMREIQARDVHAGVQQTLNDARGAAGRANSADNFGMSKWHADIVAASLRLL